MLFIYFSLCKFAKFLVSFLKAQVNSSLNFELFLISMTHNSSINNTVIPFLLWTKWSQQSPNFETPKCSGENLPNFSCNFSNHQPVFLQILHHSSMSSKMTPLYFFLAQTLYTLLKRSTLKWKFLKLLSVQVKICQIPYENFEILNEFDPSPKFVSLFAVIKKTLSTFLAQTMYTLLKRSSLKWKCLRLSSTPVKIHQITHANFETTSQFLFKFCIILHCPDT